MDDSECANPLLLRWLGEWLEESRQKNTKGVQTYKKAYDSMKACPITFSHPSEAQQLHGLGPKLCDRLTTKLLAHCRDNGLPMPQLQAPTQPEEQPAEDVPDDEEGNGSGAGGAAAAKPKKRARTTRPYVPVFRSGPYAILHALATKDGGGGGTQQQAAHSFTKAEIIQLAQPLCDSSFTAPADPTKYFTAWNAMKTLMDKDLVFEHGRPLRRYALTDDGWQVVRRLQKAGGGGGFGDDSARSSSLLPDSSRDSVEPGVGGRREGRGGERRRRGRGGREDREGTPNVDDFSDDDEGDDDETTSAAEVQNGGTNSGAESFPPSFDPLVLAPSTFTVHLVLDAREVRAKQDRDYIQEELTRRGVKPLTRSLDVGDVLWIAKRNTAGGAHTHARAHSHDEADDEVVLDWIVERKRLDDLVGSIKDGRFREQKFRLHRSGVKNVVYIIEEISMSAEVLSKYQEATESAIASTQVVDGYFVKRTQKVDDTIAYLTRLTAMLKDLYESKPLHIIPARILTPQNYLPLLAHLRATQPLTDYHVSYAAFANLASKSDLLTLRDVYLKMLMCTKGVTGDRALEMQKRWPTPVQLVDALRRCGADAAEQSTATRQADMVAAELKDLVGRKKMGKALAQKVADVWGVPC